jgi:hypothetical protein
MPGKDDKASPLTPEGAFGPQDYPDADAFDALLRGEAEPLPAEAAPEPAEPEPALEAAPEPEPEPEPVAEEPAEASPWENLDDAAFDALLREPIPEGEALPTPAPPPLPPAQSIVDEVPYVLPVVPGRVPRIPLTPPETPPAAPAPTEASESLAALPYVQQQGQERITTLEEEVARLRAEIEKGRAPPPEATPFPPRRMQRGQTGTGTDWGAVGLGGVQTLPSLRQPELERGAGPGTGIDLQGDIRAAADREMTREADFQQQYGGPARTAAAAGLGLLRGATFGFSDPALAGVRALGGAAIGDESFSDAYAAARAEIDKTRAASPWVSGLTEAGGAIAPAFLTGGAGAAGALARATPAGAVARLGESLAASQAARAAAQGAGPIMAGARGLGAAGAAEGVIGGLGVGASESMRPGMTPGQAAENLAWSAGTSGVLGGVLGGVIGGGVGALRRGAGAADELLDPAHFTERPLPTVEPSDVPMSDLRATAQVMGGNRNTDTVLDELTAADTRTKYTRNVEDVRMAEGGHEKMLQRETRAAVKDLKRWFQLRKKLDDDAGVGQKKSVNSFNETDNRPLYEPSGKQGELDFEAPDFGGVPADLPNSQAAKAEFDGMFANLRTLVDEFVSNPDAPPPRGEVLRASRIANMLEETHAQITDDLIDGKVGSAFARYTEDVRGRLLGDASKMLESDQGSDRMREFLRTLIHESGRIEDTIKNPHAVELSKRFPRAQEAQRALETQFARLRAKVDDYVGVVGEEALSRGDPTSFRIIQRIRQILDVQQASTNRFLGKGDIGGAYGAFDQGVKAAIGKEVGKAKSGDLREFLRDLTTEPMNFLEGRNASGTKVTSLWDQYIDGRDAIKRVLRRIEEIKAEPGAYKGSPKAKAAVDRVANRIKRVFRDGEMTGWQSTGYLDDLRKQINQTANSTAQWDPTLPETGHTKGLLSSLLAEDETWEALSLAERQNIGNKPWSRAISTANDSEWSQFFSTGPERAPNDWDNLQQADSAAVKRLYNNLGDAANMRDEQAYRLNLRDGAADAEARVRAWGGEAMKPDAKELVDLSRTLESRADLMAKARASKLEGEKFLAGAPGFETLTGAAAGGAGALTGMVGGPLGMAGMAAVGGAAGAQFPKWHKAWIRAVAEAQGGNGQALTERARKLVSAARKGLLGASRAADAAAPAGVHVPLALARLATEKQVRDKVEEARRVSDPQSPEYRALVEQAAQIEQVDPETADQMVQLEQRRAAAVNAVAPGDGTKIDPTTERKLTRAVTAAYFPENTLRRMSDGVATADEAQTLKQVYPQMYDAFVAEVKAQIDAQGPPKNRAGELMLFKQAGIAARSTLGQEQLRQQQVIAKSAAGEEAQPERGAVRERVSQTYKMDPDRYTTKSDRIMSE